MKAIILTFDKYRPLTEHMLFYYKSIWPDHPFQFRIPYQINPYINDDNVISIQTDKAIKASVLTLIKDLDDEEWIYWCIDDKYPISLNVEVLKKIVYEINAGQMQQVDGILFCHKKGTPKSSGVKDQKTVTIAGIDLLPRERLKPFWIHQFMKVKIIRHVFKKFPDVIPKAKVMDELLNTITIPDDCHLWLTKENLSVFGESTNEGKISQNCYDSILKHKLTMPKLTLEKNFESYYGKKPTFFENLKTKFNKVIKHKINIHD